ncbi:helix-turn-helix domain-containing protein [Clostridiaceae bacterium HSG29]|nr:helix-turn-helix domain-containing protein [Clostridiaceae bacterium HSG29]
MKNNEQDLIMDQFLNEIIKVAIKRIKEVKPWEDRKEMVATVDKKGAAKYLNMSESTIDKLIKRNEIPCLRPTGVGGTIYFRYKTLDNWMEKLENQSTKKVKDLIDMDDPFKYQVN